MMRVAILAESSADETALRILIDSILHQQTESVGLKLRSRGWPSVRQVLPAILHELHYKWKAEGLVVVADSNHSSLKDSNSSRLLELQRIAKTAASSLRPVEGRAQVQVAIGVASPALEGWLLSHRPDCNDISEAAWERGLRDGKEPYSKRDLKKRLYGVEHPSIELETLRMVEAANALIGKLDMLEEGFPTGFGDLVKSLRSWAQT